MPTAIAQSLAEIREHSSWRCGFQMACSDAALRPELVDKSATDEKISESLKATFSWAPQPKPNPPGTLSLQQECHMACAGSCRMKMHFDLADRASKNVYAAFASRKTQKKMPCLVKFQGARAGGQFIPPSLTAAPPSPSAHQHTQLPPPARLTLPSFSHFPLSLSISFSPKQCLH